MSELQRAIPDLRLLHGEMVERLGPLAIFSPSDRSALNVAQCAADEVLALIADLDEGRASFEEANSCAGLLASEFDGALRCLEK